MHQIAAPNEDQKRPPSQSRSPAYTRTAAPGRAINCWLGPAVMPTAERHPIYVRTPLTTSKTLPPRQLGSLPVVSHSTGTPKNATFPTPNAYRGSTTHPGQANGPLVPSKWMADLPTTRRFPHAFRLCGRAYSSSERYARRRGISNVTYPRRGASITPCSSKRVRQGSSMRITASPLASASHRNSNGPLFLFSSYFVCSFVLVQVIGVVSSAQCVCGMRRDFVKRSATDISRPRSAGGPIRGARPRG